MQGLIIYDDINNVFVITTASTITYPSGNLHSLSVEVADGKVITGLDTTVSPPCAIIEDIPKSEMEIAKAKIAEQEIELANLQYALMIGGLI